MPAAIQSVRGKVSYSFDGLSHNVNFFNAGKQFSFTFTYSKLIFIALLRKNIFCILNMTVIMPHDCISFILFV